MNEKRRGLFLAGGIVCIVYTLWALWNSTSALSVIWKAGNIAAEQPYLLPGIIIIAVQLVSVALLVAAAFGLWMGRPAERLLVMGVFGQAAVQAAAVLIRVGTVLPQTSLLLSAGVDILTHWISLGLVILLAVLLMLMGLSLWGVLSRRWLLPAAIGVLILAVVQQLTENVHPIYLQINDIAALQYILNTLLVTLLGCSVWIALLLIAIGLRRPKTEEST